MKRDRLTVFMIEFIRWTNRTEYKIRTKMEEIILIKKVDITVYDKVSREIQLIEVDERHVKKGEKHLKEYLEKNDYIYISGFII